MSERPDTSSPPSLPVGEGRRRVQPDDDDIIPVVVIVVAVVVVVAAVVVAVAVVGQETRGLPVSPGPQKCLCPATVSLF